MTKRMIRLSGRNGQVKESLHHLIGLAWHFDLDIMHTVEYGFLYGEAMVYLKGEEDKVKQFIKQTGASHDGSYS